VGFTGSLLNPEVGGHCFVLFLMEEQRDSITPDFALHGDIIFLKSNATGLLFY
jgi:hypothetical protein